MNKRDAWSLKEGDKVSFDGTVWEVRDNLKFQNVARITLDGWTECVSWSHLKKIPRQIKGGCKAMVNKLSFRDIEVGLHTSGGLEEQAKRTGREMNDFEKQYVDTIRTQARVAGWSVVRILETEAEGAEVIRRTLQIIGGDTK